MAQFTTRRPLLIGAISMAAGAVVGGFMRYRPEARRSLGEGVTKLKEQAATLKSSVSGLAVEGYAQAKQVARNVSGIHLEVHHDSAIPSATEHNTLVMNGSGL
jgi:hypothetical protein